MPQQDAYARWSTTDRLQMLAFEAELGHLPRSLITAIWECLDSLGSKYPGMLGSPPQPDRSPLSGRLALQLRSRDRLNQKQIDVRQLIAYCASLAGEFLARRNRVRTFVSHNLTSGTANERILRELLSDISAGTLGVTDGFFANPLQGKSSKQCDIIVYDRNFPMVYSESGVKILWPDSGLMLIEVKTSMKSVGDLQGAVDNIVSAKSIESIRRLVGCVFAFESLLAETAFEALNELSVTPEHRPFAVFLFEEGAFIQQENLYNAIPFGGGDGRYELRRCHGENPSGLVLTYLLLLFLSIQLTHARSIGHSDETIMATQQFLKLHTTIA